LVAAALMLLPMAAPSVQADRAEEPSAAATAGEKSPGVADEVGSTRPKTNWPTIVSTKPEIGATNVDPKLEEISVTFDRDMDVRSYSWTGGKPLFPPGKEDASPVWIDKRTCVLPVQLKKGSYYRVGVNSSSYQAFHSELGVPAPTSAIYFVTAGATPAVASRVRVPKAIKFLPKNGAEDVDPGLTKISVKFDVPMDTSSYSWTGGGPAFPTIAEGQKPSWSPDGKTCTLPVALSPGKRYELGLNSLNHKNFASKWGVPLEPVVYVFETRSENK
jgi:Bacterial Ig-like domain